MFTSGAKAPVFDAANGTAHFEAGTAGLKACSTPRGKDFPGLKPQVLSQLYAALKGRSSTSEVLPQRLKPVLMQAGTAGLKACSTPRGTENGNLIGMNACSTPPQNHQGWKLADSAAGAKVQILKSLYAALKGRKGHSSTATGVC